MDEAQTAAVLDALAGAVHEGIVLWRGAGLGGGDVDVVVMPGHDHAVARVLQEAGLSPAPQDPGRILWRRWPGETVVIDVLAGHAWPAMYPSLEQVFAGAEVDPHGWRVAGSADRALMFAAEAVAGWPAPKVARRLRAVLEDPGAVSGLRDRANGGDRALGALAQAPERVAGERLPLRDALAVAARSPRARAALKDRLGLGGGIALPPGDAGGPGLLLALSGMDGAGKSTAALSLVETLEREGRPVIVYWTRLAADLGFLDRIARLLRRVLRREGSTSAQELAGAGEQPPASNGATPAPEAPAAPPGLPQRAIDAGWVLAVSAVSVRDARRATRLRARGLTVICDRWLVDTLVDLRLRYGRRRGAEWLLRRGFPAADVAVLLDIDAATAAARKPGDQTPQTLAVMTELYPALADRLCDARLDARADRAAVADGLRALTRAALDKQAAA